MHPVWQLTHNNMKKVKEVLDKRPVSTYAGSPKTLAAVIEEIKSHPDLGPKYAENFDPFHDAMTFSAWKRQGYTVSKGAKAIKSPIFVETTDPETGEPRTIRKTVCLFHRIQVTAESKK